ncbi:MAG TPA: hypothetical protein VII56_22165 [Rhizomicrobium sp.]
MQRILILALALLVAAPAAAKPDNDPGYKIMHDYVLTLPKVKAYEAAYAALTTAARADPSLKAEVEAASAENDQTVAATIDKMTKHPRIYAFFQKQGLSKAEATLLPLILMDACTAAQYPTMVAQLADRMTQAQADFCKANMATIKTMHFFSGH